MNNSPRPGPPVGAMSLMGAVGGGAQNPRRVLPCGDRTRSNSGSTRIACTTATGPRGVVQLMAPGAHRLPEPRRIVPGLVTHRVGHPLVVDPGPRDPAAPASSLA